MRVPTDVLIDCLNNVNSDNAEFLCFALKPLVLRQIKRITKGGDVIDRDLLIQEGVIGLLEVNRWVILVGIQVILFFLGMVIDPLGIIMLITPILMPIISDLGFDPIWFGILFTVNMEMAYITPPFGWNLFFMKAIAPPEISMADIYRSIGPFVLLQALGLAIIMIFPQIALWLPEQMLG